MGARSGLRWPVVHTVVPPLGVWPVWREPSAIPQGSQRGLEQSQYLRPVSQISSFLQLTGMSCYRCDLHRSTPLSIFRSWPVGVCVLLVLCQRLWYQTLWRWNCDWTTNAQKIDTSPRSAAAQTRKLKCPSTWKFKQPSFCAMQATALKF